ncbi:MAG: NUDIX domain-containing protein [Bacteroidales bacterium]|nr:NUDIX domain-containing protein [Bacteroidales bacterium]
MQKYVLFHKYHGIDELYTIISDFLLNDEIYSINIYSYKIDSLWKAFRDYFETHIAAGGLLINDKDELLFIKRYDKWDIAKGHLSEKESLVECARREVQEETGLSAGSMLTVLRPSWHIYQIGEAWILKETHWYIFNFSGEGKALPQQSENISEVRWFSRDELRFVHDNTWPSISDVVHEAVFKLFDHQAP